MGLIFLGIMLLIHGTYYWALRLGKFAIIDIAWALGFSLVALLGLLQTDVTPAKWLLLVMCLVWSTRLAVFLYYRNKGQPEDFRYAKLKSEWGDRWKIEGYKKVFLFQGLLMFIVSLPVQLGMSSEMTSIGLKQILGLIVWLVGFSLETWADYYLQAYKRNPANKGKLCMNGPWKICRYPNYFGEMLLWWGIWIYIAAFWTAWTFIGPLVLCWVMIKLSGIPFLEEKRLERQDYQQYAARTPRLWPLTWRRLWALKARHTSV